MKKFLAVLCVVSISLCLFAFGLGGAGAAEKKPDKLVLMNAGTLSGDPGIDFLRQEWGKKHGITIEVIEQAERYLFDKELAALSSQDPSIDLMAANERWVRDWAAAGWLQPLDDIMKETVPYYTP
nr:extracellular solute-binding protein [Deltaproteobacteria bacterium]